MQRLQRQSICVHQAEAHCYECNPLDLLLANRSLCSVCGAKRVNPRKRSMCATCDKSKRDRTEHVVLAKLLPLLLAKGHGQPTIADDKHIANNKAVGDCSYRRPDTCWVKEDRVIHYECNEDSHVSYGALCQLAKMDETNYGLSKWDGNAKLPTVIVQFNPDASDGVQVDLDTRVQALAGVLDYYFKLPVDELGKHDCRVVYMFYHSKAKKHIQMARDQPLVFEVIEVDNLSQTGTNNKIW